jgi:four helix bundle protein
MRDEKLYFSPVPFHRSSLTTAPRSPLTALLYNKFKKKQVAQINSFRDLIVYQKAYKLAMEIFEVSKTFPKEEKYSLTDQIRRSSRSVTTSIAEGWAKRIYPKHFVSKMTDSLSEEFETEVWLDYSRDCKYIDTDQHEHFRVSYEEVRKMLISMMNAPEKFCK